MLYVNVVLYKKYLHKRQQGNIFSLQYKKLDFFWSALSLRSTFESCVALSLFAIIRVQVMCGVIMDSRASTGEAQQRIPLVVWCHLLQFVFKKHKHKYINF